MNNKPLDKEKAEAELKSLLAKGIDCKDSQGRTPLILAFEQERFDFAKELISKGANINVKDNQGRTPLMIAIQKGQTDMAILLINNGADISILANSSVITPQFLKEHPEIVKYVTNGGNGSEILSTTTAVTLNAEDINGEAIRDYIAHGGNVNDIVNHEGQTCLMLAAQKDDAETVQWLIDNGANVNHQDKNGRTSLMFSAMSGFLKTQEALLKNGADPNIQDNDGKTALIFSAQENQLESAKMLVEYNADITIKDNDGKNALMIAAEQGNLDILIFLNEDCVEKEDPKQDQNKNSSQQKEDKDSSDKDQKESDKTAQDKDKNNNKDEEEKESTSDSKDKENKEDKESDDKDKSKDNKDNNNNNNNNNNGGGNSFSFAMREQPCVVNSAAKTERKKYYVAKKIDLNEQDKNGETALMLAVRAGRRETFSYLAKQQNIDFSLRNKQGKSVLDIAKENNDDFFAEVLRQIETNKSSLSGKRFTSEDVKRQLSETRSNIKANTPEPKEPQAKSSEFKQQFAEDLFAELKKQKDFKNRR